MTANPELWDALLPVVDTLEVLTHLLHRGFGGKQFCWCGLVTSGRGVKNLPAVPVWARRSARPRTAIRFLPAPDPGSTSSAISNPANGFALAIKWHQRHTMPALLQAQIIPIAALYNTVSREDTWPDMR